MTNGRNTASTTSLVHSNSAPSYYIVRVLLAQFVKFRMACEMSWSERSLTRPVDLLTHSPGGCETSIDQRKLLVGIVAPPDRPRSRDEQLRTLRPCCAGRCSARRQRGGRRNPHLEAIVVPGAVMFTGSEPRPNGCTRLDQRTADVTTSA